MLEKQYVVASFLHKLWSMLEDENNSSIISWSEDGTSFVVHDQSRFAKEILPKFYKHNNMASFIRQLNMYGFSKISHDPSHNALYAVKNSESSSVEFHHPQFMRGQAELVASIKRKSTIGNHIVPAQSITTAPPPPQFKSQNLQNDPMAQRVLSDVQQLHKKQDSFNNQLEQLRHENEALWRDMENLRQKCHSQQAIISKVVNFLVSMIGTGGSGIGTKRSIPMLESDRVIVQNSQNNEGPVSKHAKMFDFSENTGGSNSGVTIREIIEEETPSPAYEVNPPSTVDTSASEQTLEPPVKFIPLSKSATRPTQLNPVSNRPENATLDTPTIESSNPFTGDEFNQHLDNVQLDLDQLRSNLRTYFSNNNANNTNSSNDSGQLVDEDFLADLFTPDQPLPLMESPLPSPTTLATPVASPGHPDSEAKTVENQLVRYLPPKNYLISGSTDPLLIQPSSSNSQKIAPSTSKTPHNTFK